LGYLPALATWSGFAEGGGLMKVKRQKKRTEKYSIVSTGKVKEPP